MTDQTIQIVGMASDGFEAVQRAIESKPDLVLLSVGLHKLNGVEAAKRISEAVPGVKLLFPTQNIDPDVMTEALSKRTVDREVKRGTIPTATGSVTV